MHRRALSCLLFAACASPAGGALGPDAGAGDASPDAAWGEVEISAVDFVDPSRPGAALPIEISDPSGAVIARAKTDATGEASVNVPAGAMVTIAWPGERHVETIAGLAAGDHLHVGAEHRTVGAPTTVTVSMPPPPAKHATVLGPCPGDAHDAEPAADGTWTAMVELRPGCAPYAVVADAWDEADHEIGYLAATDVAASAESTISLTGAWKTMPELHVRATGADIFNVERVSGPARFSIWRDLTKPDAFDGAIAAPDVLPRADAVISVWIDGHPFELALALPAGATDQTIDVGPYLLPAITSAAIDAERTRVTWATTGSGAPDAISIELDDSTTWESWYLLVPPGTTSIALPPVPAGLAFGVNDQVLVSMSLDETDALADYAAARNLPLGGIDALLNADSYQHWSRAPNAL